MNELQSVHFEVFANHMNPIHCQECGRANGAAAKRCLWCGVPLVGSDYRNSFEATRIEIEYLDGIERLDNPTPVKLAVDGEGVEVSEIMPGSRSIKLPASAILEAKAVDASLMVENEPGRWSQWFGLIGKKNRGKKEPQTKKHDYVLTVKYDLGDKIRIAVFHREDRSGQMEVERMARIITMLVRLQSQK